MTLEVLNGPTIAEGESLSDGIDCSAGPLVRITMPAEWTPANITFQVSSDGNLYNDVFDVDGNEITMPVHPGAAVKIPLTWSPILGFLKIRSGTSTHPVEQDAERSFAVAVETGNEEPPAA